LVTVRGGVLNLVPPLMFLQWGGIYDGSPLERFVGGVAHGVKRFVMVRVKARWSTSASKACVVMKVVEFLLHRQELCLMVVDSC
jgi:hypothetical protein